MKKIFQTLYSNDIIMLLITVLIFAACSSGKHAAAPAEQNITQAIDSNKWVFTASNAKPLYGSPVQLNSTDYSVTFKDNKLVVYLPYYGKAYAGADVLSGKSTLDFTTEKYTIKNDRSNDGDWSILFKPKDYNEVQSLSFRLFRSGSASLDVILQNRSAISFDGRVAPVK